MFVPCPHCQFLVAHHPQLRPLPAACPRCGGALDETAEAAPAVVEAPPLPAEEPAGAAADAEVPVPATQAPLEVDAAAEAEAAAEAGTGAETDADAEGEAGTGPRAQTGAETGPPTADPNAATPADPVLADKALQPHPANTATAPAPASAASTAQAPQLPRRAARWQWPLVAGLALLLPLQAALADRHRLAGDPAWRPAVTVLCKLMFCELPAWRAPTEFRMLHSQIRRNASGVLRLDATFRNDARWEQPWPALQLALADADGRTLGSTVVSPEQYLGAAPDGVLAPGQSAQITFLVQEPAPGTVGFHLRFR